MAGFCQGKSGEKDTDTFILTVFFDLFNETASIIQYQHIYSLSDL